MKVLGIIPARGGSKGVPRKNLAPVGGRPLIEHTISEAKLAKTLSRVIVSTEDEEIARVAREAGADVPFMRPAELATDLAQTFPVLLHALREVERLDACTYDIVVLLQPTTPLRTAADIDAGVELLQNGDAESVISIVDVVGNHPFRMKRLLDDGRIINYVDQGFEDMRPRQSLPPVYIRSGALYVTRRNVMVEQNRFVSDDCLGLVIPRERAVNIDDEIDLHVADQLLRRRSSGGA
jgi:CMP-N-acetylneuraminic acid synthetase